MACIQFIHILLTCAAVAFYYNGTSFCFVNTTRRDYRFKIVSKYEDDLSWDLNSYHHVFWFGDLNPATISLKRWMDLYADTENGSLAWRSLPDCEISNLQTTVLDNTPAAEQKKKTLESQSDMLHNADMAASSFAMALTVPDRNSHRQPSGLSPRLQNHHRPFAAHFKVASLLFPQVATKKNISIIFSELKAERLVTSDFRGKISPYIIFEAPFVEEGSRTSAQNVSKHSLPPPHTATQTKLQSYDTSERIP